MIDKLIEFIAIETENLLQNKVLQHFNISVFLVISGERFSRNDLLNHRSPVRIGAVSARQKEPS